MTMWSECSQKVYDELHPDLQRLVDKVNGVEKIELLCGYRNETDQMAAYYARPQKSWVKWPDSKHNRQPSLAVDWSPLPINWKSEKFLYVAGMFVMAAQILCIKCRWGGNWDMDADILEAKETDLGHIELQDKAQS